MIEIIGYSLAISGAVLGVIGAWLTASKETPKRHLGFLCWIANSPMIVISLAGIAMGIWQGINAWFFVPLNCVYWGTAVRGFLNTKSEQSCKKCVQCGTETCQTPPGEYEVVKLEGWRDK